LPALEDWLWHTVLPLIAYAALLLIILRAAVNCNGWVSRVLFNSA